MALQENSTLSGHTLGFHPQAQSLDHLLHCSKQYHRPGGGGGYSHQFRIGVCRQGSQTLTLFKGQKSRTDVLLKAQNQEMAPYLRETR